MSAVGWAFLMKLVWFINEEEDETILVVQHTENCEGKW